MESIHSLKGLKSNPFQIARDFLLGSERNVAILSQVQLKQGKDYTK